MAGLAQPPHRGAETGRDQDDGEGAPQDEGAPPVDEGLRVAQQCPSGKRDNLSC